MDNPFLGKLDEPSLSWQPSSIAVNVVLPRQPGGVALVAVLARQPGAIAICIIFA